MAIKGTGQATFTRVEDYSAVFMLNGVLCEVLNFDTVRGMEQATLEADFFNGGAACVMTKAVITCYDAEGTVLGSPIEVSDTSTALVDGGNLYLSKDCKSIACEGYVDGRKACAVTIPVVRDGESVGVKGVTYKVINNVAAGASLNWDAQTAVTTYPTQKPDKGKYCYVMTIVTYTDGTMTNSVSTSYTPTDGTNGSNGTSVRIASTSVAYAGSDSGTSAPASGWQGTVPQLAQGKFLWTRTIVSYSDGNSTTSYSVGRIGKDGSKGGTTHILYASSANPQSDSDVRTTIDAAHQYYGTYRDTDIDDHVENYTKVTSWVLIKGDAGHTPVITIGSNGNWYIDGKDSGQKAQGDKGATPTVSIGSDGYWYINGVKTSQKAQGEKGVDGTQYKTVERYAYGTSNTTAPTSGWSDSISGGKSGQYLWNQETAQHKAASDSNWVTDSVTTHCIGYIAKDGEPGANFTGLLEYYKANDDGTNPPAIDSSWKSTPSAAGWSAEKPYLWNYEIVTRDKGANITTAVHLDSVWGSKGDPGATGPAAVSYRLVRMDDTEATVKATDSGSGTQYRLHYVLHYKAMKAVGGTESEAKIYAIGADIEGEKKSAVAGATDATLSGDGTTAYDATNRPAASIPVTVVLADGKLLYDGVAVTMEAGVAVDIDNRIGKLTTTVAGKADISTLEQTAGRISAKVAGLGLRNLLMDSEFRCPVEKTISRYGKKYREAWNNGASVTVTDTANGISAEGVNAVKATSAVKDGYWTVTRWYVPARQGQTYTASAWCMVPDVSVLTGDSMCLLQLFACNDDFTRSNDSKAYGTFSDLSSGVWKRVSCSLTMPQDSAYTYVEVALAAYKCGTVYFRQPQLEYGSEATEWTRCAADVEGGLLATGIDIEDGKITLTADNVSVRNSSGTATAMLDSSGKLRTDMIDTDELVAKRIMTKNDGEGRTEIHDNTTVWYQKDGATPGIKVTYDNVGLPHLIFYSTTGDEMYDLGASGLQSLLQGVQPASILARDMYNVDSVANTPVALSSLLSDTPTAVGTYSCAYTTGSGGTKIYVIQSSDYSALDGKVIVGYSAVDKNGNDYKNFTLANGYWLKAFTLENNNVKHYVSAGGVSGPENERGWHNMPFSGSGAYHFSVPCMQFSEGVCVKAGYIYINQLYGYGGDIRHRK